MLSQTKGAGKYSFHIVFVYKSPVSAPEGEIPLIPDSSNIYDS
jgi:hypothetical protein